MTRVDIPRYALAGPSTFSGCLSAANNATPTVDGPPHCELGSDSATAMPHSDLAVFTWTLRLTSIAIAVGMYQLNTNNIGLTELIRGVWSAYA
ncbi:hypothetical protein BGY98DRAFT_1092532 [Russula aff. rugulosa BPL654]|nr:hypothetical protein BGY98DRAFT_1092532 [Russula aff. rugulosa BPL654]